MFATTYHPHQQVVSNDDDLIALRQAIRQTARAAGLGPPQQARITAAISEVARVMLHHDDDPLFTVRVSERAGVRAALEVVCTPHTSTNHNDASRAYSDPSLQEACALVDDSTLEDGWPSPRLTLRMWIGR